MAGIICGSSPIAIYIRTDFCAVQTRQIFIHCFSKIWNHKCIDCVEISFDMECVYHKMLFHIVRLLQTWKGVYFFVEVQVSELDQNSFICFVFEAIKVNKLVTLI